MGITAFSAAALIPPVDAAPLRSLSVGTAIRYLCDDVFASPAEKAARVVPPMRHQFTV
jgi:hypothetical protein